MEHSQEELLAHLNGMFKGTTMEMLNIKIVSAEKDRLVGTMPIEHHQRQVSGYLHGGISVVLAETLASLGSMLNIDTDKQAAFGLEINANHLRPKREGIVTGVATAIHKGRTTHVWDIKISDEHDKLICVSRCTVAIVQKPADN